MDEEFDNPASSPGDEFIDDQLELTCPVDDLSLADSRADDDSNVLEADETNDLDASDHKADEADDLEDCEDDLHKDDSHKADDLKTDDSKADHKSPQEASTNGDENKSEPESESQDFEASEDVPSRNESIKELSISREVSISRELSREDLSRDEYSRDNQLDYETDSSLRSVSNGLAYNGHPPADESSKEDLSKEDLSKEDLSKDDLSKGDLSNDEPSNGQASTNGLPEQPSDLANGCKSEQSEKQNESSVSKCAKDDKPSRKEGSKSTIIVHLLNGGRFECPVTVSVWVLNKKVTFEVRVTY